MSLAKGDPVEVRIGRQTFEGRVDAVRWRPHFNVGDRHRVVVDTGRGRNTASRSQVVPVEAGSNYHSSFEGPSHGK